MKMTITMLILTLAIVSSTSFTQYKMSIKKVDNTIQEIWVHDIIDISFTNVAFACGTSTITYGGKSYNTVLIGSQCWLKGNLDVGTRINGSSNQTDNSIIEKYCYNDNDANCNTYGALYQWNEAMQYETTEGMQGICPTGWHIPTQVELQTLKTIVGNDGNALKAIGEGTGSGTGTNTSGFSALLAGYRYYADGAFSNLGEYTFFWSSTKYFATSLAYYIYLMKTNSDIAFNTYEKNFGISLRCIKN
jgi:uncharacterized protein (TIGR02145 family)